MPPIYDYECKDCKKEYDVFYSSQDAAKREEKKEKCPHCGSKKKRKLISRNTSFQLNGKGWYRDGY